MISLVYVLIYVLSIESFPLVLIIIQSQVEKAEVCSEMESRGSTLTKDVNRLTLCVVG